MFQTFHSREMRYELSRSCRLERLEDRRLLAAQFLRVGGYTSAEADVYAGASHSYDQHQSLQTDFETNNNADLSHASASASAGVEGATALAHADSTALVLTPTGSSTLVPTASIAYASLGQASGIGPFDETGNGDWVYAGASGESNVSNGVNAVGDFTLDTDGETLFARGVIFLAGYGGYTVSGEGGAVASTSVHADITVQGTVIATAGASYNGHYWDVSGSIPGLGSFFYSKGSLNEYFVFPIPLINEGIYTFLASGAAPWVGFNAGGYDSGSASIQVFGAASAWGFLTQGPANLPPGDFNGDGQVNHQDLDIWSQNQGIDFGATLAQGDADHDGDVDADDYDICVENATDLIVVSTSVDENDADYSFGDLSLREAIVIAGDVNHPGANTIAFDTSVRGSTSTLTLGQLAINSDVSIIGPGISEYALQGRISSADRIFSISPGVTAAISTLKLIGGRAPGIGDGGAVYNQGVLKLNSILVSGNIAARYGGGILNAGDLTLDSVVVDGNQSNRGAGIYQVGALAHLEILDSTIKNNIATAYGGGIAAFGGVVEILGTTIASNSAGISSGGIYSYGNNASPTSLSMTNSTVSINSRGGIQISGTSANSTAEILNCTIAFNGNGPSQGPGLPPNAAGLISNGGVTLNNTIVASNANGDVNGNFVLGSSNNLIGIVQGGHGTNLANGVNGNLVGSNAFPVPANLGPLSNNGGKTLTHALLPGSPAIDHGSNSAAVSLNYDQRGARYDRIKDGGLGLIVDIGAVEYRQNGGTGSASTISFAVDVVGPNSGVNNEQASLLQSRSNLNGVDRAFSEYPALNRTTSSNSKTTLLLATLARHRLEDSSELIQSDRKLNDDIGQELFDTSLVSLKIQAL